ncbi:Protein NUCLEAR FUSION DEFECTIVE 4 [Diplonema papillatum]|nr:Protein NUCLEAR FUSION DEFECTIVE 4 [Diplonema papillatum]|eukprot:gene22375-34263_t
MGYGQYWNAWVSISASLMIQFCAGNLYLFGTYSEEIKAVLFEGDERGQSKLQTIALVGNIFAFMPVAGIWYDSKFGGVTSTLLIGVVLTFSGYFFLHRVVTGWNSGWALACAFAAFWGHGSGYYDAAALTTAVKNAPKQQALVVGSQKAFLGLAGTVITQASFTFFDGNTAGYLLFVAFVCSVPALVSTLFLCETAPIPPSDATATGRFNRIFVVLTVLATGMLAASLSRAVENTLPHDLEVVIFALSALCLPLLFYLISGNVAGPRPYYYGSKRQLLDFVAAERRRGSADCEARALVQPPKLDEAGWGPRGGGSPHPLTGGEVDCSKGGGEAAGLPVDEDVLETDGVPPGLALRTPEFWLLFVVLGTGTGGGLTIINNAAQIIIASGGTDRDADIAVSLLYVFNSFGRIFLCIFSDRLSRAGVSRVFVFSATILLHALAHATLFIPSNALNYPGFCLAGLSYGGMQAVFPAVVSDLFGLRYFASNYMWMMFSPSVGSLGFSTFLASSIYEFHQTKDPVTGDVDCVGRDCFFLTHVVICASCVAAFGVGLVLHFRIKRHKGYVKQSADDADYGSIAKERD